MRKRQVLDRLSKLVNDDANLSEITKAFRLVNARLYLAFHGVPQGPRPLKMVKHELLTVGDVLPPIPLDAGPTGRRALATQDTARVAVNAGAEQSLPVS